METTLICLSHLRWDHVWQRPHHLMSRIAQHVPVIFMEEPIIGSWPEIHEPVLEERPGLARVRVVRPLLPHALLDTPGNSFREMWGRLFDHLLSELGAAPIIWEYSPMMVFLTEQAGARLVVHDCMDELANFRGAPSDIREREARLMELSDLVFTGGRSLYEARKDRHQRIHCFPSGVDVAHYQRALDPDLALPDDIAAISEPRLGYFGVLDERIDWGLIAGVAAERPDWQWVLIGPTSKVDPADLPQAPNIHYLGQRNYADLPAYLKGFAVATMPFALNESTQYISPTKTLEYMAGHAPIVSTPVPDVASSYAEIVGLAEGVPAFVAAVEAALNQTATDVSARREREQAVLAEKSWDGIATQMWALIEEQLAAKATNRPSG